MARAVLSDMCGAGVSRRSAFGRLIMAVKTTARIRVVKMAVRACARIRLERQAYKSEVDAAPTFGSAASPHESQIHRDLFMKDAGSKRAWSGEGLCAVLI